MLIRKSALQPVLKKTARGGMKMARRYAKTSDELDAAIVYDVEVISR